MRFAILFIGLFMSLAAHAGGISFGPEYRGLHPVTGTRVTLNFNGDRKATLVVADTLGRAENLHIAPKSRNNFETIFELREENAEGELVANVITTGDCQVVRALAVVFPSGLTVPMKEQKRRAERK